MPGIGAMGLPFMSMSGMPGIVDSITDDLLLEDGHAQSKIRQGVTTEILGEGRSVAPLKGQLAARKFAARGKQFTWSTVGGYFDAIDAAGSQASIDVFEG